MPEFYSLDMSRIPAVGAEHVDVSALLQEVTSLRAGVRSLASVRAEIANIKDAVSSIRLATEGATSLATVGCSTDTCIRGELDELKATMKSFSTVSNTEFPPLSADSFNKPDNKSKCDINSLATKATLAQLVELHNTGMSMRSQATRPKQQAKSTRKPVIGASADNKHISAVKTYRNVDVFVTRLHPQTAVNELVNCVDKVKGDLLVYDTKCKKTKVTI